ncbi:MAG: TniQ family protein [Pleurocapsa sp. MO_192.B19]|nr:TniQ family protein [Pleurocapsa sp. MO_192.B19]
MDVEAYSVEELWSPKPCQLPIRSRLNHLEPMAINTPFVESLTSYITRLAESHSVLVSTLMTREIAPILTNDNTEYGSKRGLNSLFNCGAAINSTGEIVKLFLDSLTQLTLNNNLSALTLLSLKGCFSDRELLSRSKTWCPDCYQDWKKSKKVIYEPLLWTFKSVEVCPIHKQSLQTVCPSCDRKIPWFTSKSRVGYCCYCQQWLGSLSKTERDSNLAIAKEDLAQSIWIANALGELVASSEKLNRNNNRDRIPLSIREIVNLTQKGNIAAFARAFNLPKNTVWMWCKGKSVPQLKHILSVCYALDISLLDFLVQNDFEKLQIDSQKLPRKISSKRISPQNFDLLEIEKFLQSVLQDRESTPTTMKEIAKELAIDQRTLSKHFPELCQAISAKYRNYQAKIRKKKIDKSCREVKQAVFTLVRKGEYPSEARVSQLISQPGNFRYKQVRMALKEARSEN